jgi:hypothetical protein
MEKTKKSMTPGLFLLDDRPEAGIDSYRPNHHIDGTIGVLSRFECLCWNMQLDAWLQSRAGAVKVRMRDQIHADCQSATVNQVALTI